MSLPALLASAIPEEASGSLAATIGAAWLQGRTAYGGTSAALALFAAKQSQADLPPLRSAQIAFVGPLSGKVEAHPELLRRGKNSAFIACDVTGEDGIGLRALFLFMAPRSSTISQRGPLFPPVSDPAIGQATEHPNAPGFLQNFDLSSEVSGKGSYRRWVRLKDRTELDPEVELIAAADALPPAAMSLSTTWGPISTTTWQLNLLTATPRSTDGWWLLDATSLHAVDGSSSQAMTIWSREGDAVATATQSVALFL